MNINAIGAWTLRIILAVGAIVSGLIGNTDVSGACVVVLIFSFFALDT